jgi:hypothetical protein
MYLRHEPDSFLEYSIPVLCILLFTSANFCLYIQQNQEGLKLNGLSLLYVYADDVRLSSETEHHTQVVSTPALYSGDARFKFQLRDWLS